LLAVSLLPKLIQSTTHIRHSQGWVDEVYDNLDDLMKRALQARERKEAVSLAYQGNVVDLWERFVRDGISVDLGSDQTSLHNPFSGGYYPAGLTFDEANEMMAQQPEKFQREGI
jgi:urocanate hydratase